MQRATTLAQQPSVGQQPRGARVGPHHLTASVQQDHAARRRIEQWFQGGGTGIGFRQGLANANSAAEVGQQTRQYAKVRRAPVALRAGATNRPKDVRAVQRSQACRHLVLNTPARQELVVGDRSGPLFFREEIGIVQQAASRHQQEPRHALVNGEITLDVFARESVQRDAVAKPSAEQVFRGASASRHHGQVAAVRQAGVVDQREGARPGGVVQRRIVQRGDSTLESLVVGERCRATRRTHRRARVGTAIGDTRGGVRPHIQLSAACGCSPARGRALEAITRTQ